MTSARLAIVSMPALDLRAEPDHRAELVTQALMGEAVTVGASRSGGWRRVTLATDAYAGWAKDWGLVPCDLPRMRRWLRRATAVVEAPIARLRARPAGGLAVAPLPWMARAIPVETRGRAVRLELPDARVGWLARSEVRLRGDAPPSIESRIFSLLGVPYLWGGRSAAGLDCSGLVQLVLAEQGRHLPRDARDQHAAARPLAVDERPDWGDLAFFARDGEPMSHVGLSCGGSLFAHSRGWVRIASLDADNPLYDKALSGQFRGWFRLPGRPRRKRLRR